MGLSKTCKKCRECSFKDICNNKKMEAYATYSESKSSLNSKTLREPMGIAYTPITINLGEGDKIQTSLEELKKQMEKEFYKKLGLGI